MIGDLIKIKPEEVRAQRAAKQKKPPLWKRRWVRFTLLSLLLLGLGGYVIGMWYLRQFRERAAQFDLTEMKKLEISTLVHDRSGKVIGELAEESRRLVSLNEVPLHLIQALTAAEDGRFFEHQGVDYWGIGRAFFWTYIMRQGRQGGSTITQQLARQTFASADPSMLEKTKERKLTEIFLARRIEENFTKSEILEMYLNRIYFGSGCWGVNAAAMRYFGKPAKDLTLVESATLCGLIKSPERYSPLKDLAAATRNRNIVLDRMVDERLLAREDADKLKAEVIKLSPTVAAKGGGYVLDMIHAEVGPILEKYGYDEVAGKGLHIYTSLDEDVQKRTEESVAKRLDEIEGRSEYRSYLRELNERPERKARPRHTYAEYSSIYDAWQKKSREELKASREAPPEPEANYLQAAVIVLDNKTGDVLAMAGGRDWNHNKINLALSKPGHTPGTAFFPFVYAAGFEDKMFPGTRLSDEPLDNSRIMVGSLEGILGEWGREGQTENFQGKITARGALVQSMNGATARLGIDLGLPKIQAFAKRAGLEEVKDLPASILGSSECPLRELALGYSTFPNGGVRPAETRLVTKVTDSQGRLLWERQVPGMIKVTDDVTAYMITSCLEDALSVGTGATSRELGMHEFPAAGKTGTHYDFRDLHFAGYTSAVTCAVWVGLRDRPETIYPSAFSHRCALPIWVDVMNAAAEKHAPKPFVKPPKIDMVDLCASSGLRATDHCFEVQEDPTSKRRMNVKTTYQEYIRPGFRLDSLCDVHGTEHRHDAIEPPKPPVISAGSNLANDRTQTSVNPIPVLLRAPTVVGNDPYKSVQPEIAASNPASPGTAPPQPGTSILEVPDLGKKEKIDLPEPPPVKID